MAITVTKLANNPRFFLPGATGIEFSVTFDTVYAATNGESLGFGTNTNFKTKVCFMQITKPFRSTTQNYWIELANTSATTEAATTARLKVRKQLQASNTNKTIQTRYVTTGQSLAAVKGRILVVGY